MTGQPWLAGTFAALMILTAAYCLTRLAVSARRGRPTDRAVDGMHALMGVAMAGMLAPGLRLPWAGGWELLFGAGAALFAGRIVRAWRGRTDPEHRAGHDAQHLLGCAAMLYMLALAGRAAAGLVLRGAGMSGAAAPGATLALVLAVGVLGFVAWTADRISSMPPVAVLAAAAGRAGRGGWAMQPAGAAGPGSPAPAGPSPGATGRDRPVPLSPRLSACCEIAMGVTMGYMLVMML